MKTFFLILYYLLSLSGYGTSIALITRSLPKKAAAEATAPPTPYPTPRTSKALSHDDDDEPLLLEPSMAPSTLEPTKYASDIPSSQPSPHKQASALPHVQSTLSTHPPTLIQQVNVSPVSVSFFPSFEPLYITVAVGILIACASVAMYTCEKLRRLDPRQCSRGRLVDISTVHVHTEEIRYEPVNHDPDVEVPTSEGNQLQDWDSNSEGLSAFWLQGPEPEAKPEARPAPEPGTEEETKEESDNPPIVVSTELDTAQHTLLSLPEQQEDLVEDGPVVVDPPVASPPLVDDYTHRDWVPILHKVQEVDTPASEATATPDDHGVTHGHGHDQEEEEEKQEEVDAGDREIHSDGQDPTTSGLDYPNCQIYGRGAIV